MISLAALLLFNCIRGSYTFATPKSEFLLEIDGNGVAVSREHICAIQQKHDNVIGGRAKCWGSDITGSLDAPDDVEFIQLISGHFFACGVSIDQVVHCWGQTPGMQGVIPGLYTQITADSDARYACGLLIDGKVNCWGSLKAKRKLPEQTGRYLQISCSISHCCALDERGYPICWGDIPTNLELHPPQIDYQEYLQSKENFGWIVKEDRRNRRGTGTGPGEEEDEDEEDYDDADITAASGSSQVAKSLVQYRQISVSNGLSCGITLLGAHLQCWGKEDIFRRQRIPKRNLGPYRQVSVGGLGVCAIYASPEDMNGDEDLLKVQAISSSSDQGEEGHEPDGLQCWGNVIHYLPSSNKNSSTLFSGWDQVKVGSNTFCGVSINSELECWGDMIPNDQHHIHRSLVIA